MRETPYRIGLVGAGDVVKRAYLPALAARSDCRVAAVCGGGGASAAQVGARLAARVCADHRELLDDVALDGVFVCTPTDLHAPMAAAAMARKLDVLVEKPLCPDFARTRELLTRARSYDRTFYVVFNNYFREENQWLRAAVLDGRVGEVELIDLEWLRPRRHGHKAWPYDLTRAGGGVLLDLGIHFVHFALSLLPERRTFTASGHVIRRETSSRAVDDTVAALVVVDGAVAIALKLGWAMEIPERARVNLRVFGRRGEIANAHYAGARTDGYGHVLDDFMRCVAGERRTDLDLVEDAAQVVDAIYRAGATGAAVPGRFARAA